MNASDVALLGTLQPPGGTRILPPMNGTLFCNKCGTQNDAAAQFCNRCGGALSPAPASVPVPVGAPAYPVARPVTAAHYGGFWIRVVAAIIDTVIVRLVVFPVSALFGLAGLTGMMMPGLPHIGIGMHLLGGGVVVVLVMPGPGCTKPSCSALPTRRRSVR